MIEDYFKPQAIGLDGGQITINSSWTPRNSRGSEVEVQGSYTFQFVTGGLLSGVGIVPLTATSTRIMLN